MEKNNELEVIDVNKEEIKEDNTKKILTIEDIIAKKDECKKRKEIKYVYVYSEFLGGNLKAHSLNKSDRNDVREKIQEDSEKGANYFIYISIDMLRNDLLLDKFGCKKKNNLAIVDALFTDAEKGSIIEILGKLNGFDNLSDNAIMSFGVKELQGE